MAVVFVDKRLEIAHLNHLAAILLTFNERVHLKRIFTVLGEQLLDHLVVQKLMLSEAQNLEGLFFRHEAALDTETFLSYLLAAHVSKLLHR